MPRIMFQISSTNGLARRGVLATAHGDIQTPFFMPIATKGAVKTLTSADLETLGAEIILSNTYHLMLRPGSEALVKLGGLHQLAGWNRSLLTDSGGYQVFSLPNQTNDDGVEFKSPIDGTKHFLTPELSMQMQAAIGADIFMQFDDVAAGVSSRERYEEAMERSLRWAERSKRAFEAVVGAAPVAAPGQAQGLPLQFAIVQGGTHQDLRQRSAEELVKIGFDGYAIGGLSVGENREDTYRVAKYVAGLLPEDKPRYFMGGGFPEEIVYYVSVGIDMFDCVLPTRNARHGTLFIWKEDPSVCVPKALGAAQAGTPVEELALMLYDQIHITNEQYAFDQTPLSVFASEAKQSLDQEIAEPAQSEAKGLSDSLLAKTSKAYLRHLFMVEEPLALRLATLQNVDFYLRLMSELRRAIAGK